MRKVRVRCWIWHKTIEQSVNMSNRSASVWYERRMEFWIGVLLNLDAILFGWMSGECNTSHHLSLHIDFLVTRFCLLDCRYFRHRKGRQEKLFCLFFHTLSHWYLAEDIQPPNVGAFGTSLSRKRPRFQRCAPKWDTWNALAWVDDFRVIWLIAVEQDGWRFETAWRHHARLRKLSAIELCGLNYASLWY